MNLVHVTFIVHHSKNIYYLSCVKQKHYTTSDIGFTPSLDIFFLVKTIRIVHRKQLLFNVIYFRLPSRRYSVVNMVALLCKV
jgi:hypothetical protein